MYVAKYEITDVHVRVAELQGCLWTAYCKICTCLIDSDL
jgi:hypothetical protein